MKSYYKTSSLSDEIELSQNQNSGSNNLVKCKLILGKFEWFILEYEPNSKQAYGFVNLNDPKNAEYGYFNIQELENFEFNGEIKELISGKSRIIQNKVRIDQTFCPTPISKIIDEIKSRII